jgi:hypothetical protein
MVNSGTLVERCERILALRGTKPLCTSCQSAKRRRGAKRRAASGCRAFALLFRFMGCSLRFPPAPALLSEVVAAR